MKLFRLCHRQTGNNPSTANIASHTTDFWAFLPPEKPSKPPIRTPTAFTFFHLYTFGYTVFRQSTTSTYSLLRTMQSTQPHTCRYTVRSPVATSAAPAR
jgi:hypothetical protein